MLHKTFIFVNFWQILLAFSYLKKNNRHTHTHCIGDKIFKNIQRYLEFSTSNFPLRSFNDFHISCFKSEEGLSRASKQSKLVFRSHNRNDRRGLITSGSYWRDRKRGRRDQVIRRNSREKF